MGAAQLIQVVSEEAQGREGAFALEVEESRGDLGVESDSQDIGAVFNCGELVEPVEGAIYMFLNEIRPVRLRLVPVGQDLDVLSEVVIFQLKLCLAFLDSRHKARVPELATVHIFQGVEDLIIGSHDRAHSLDLKAVLQDLDRGIRINLILLLQVEGNLRDDSNSDNSFEEDEARGVPEDFPQSGIKHKVDGDSQH